MPSGQRTVECPFTCYLITTKYETVFSPYEKMRGVDFTFAIDLARESKQHSSLDGGKLMRNCRISKNTIYIRRYDFLPSQGTIF
jgi:hypothetical protein